MGKTMPTFAAVLSSAMRPALPVACRSFTFIGSCETCWVAVGAAGREHRTPSGRPPLYPQRAPLCAPVKGQPLNARLSGHCAVAAPTIWWKRSKVAWSCATTRMAASSVNLAIAALTRLGSIGAAACAALTPHSKGSRGDASKCRAAWGLEQPMDWNDRRMLELRSSRRTQPPTLRLHTRPPGILCRATNSAG